jgi:hypothetical protein
MKSKGAILVIAGDPGGARALIPVIPRIKSPIKLYAYNQAKEIFASEVPDLPCLALPLDASDQQAYDIIKKEEAQFLLAGSSVNTLNWEKHFFRASKKHGLCSLAVLDFWTHYRERFEINPGQLDACPNHIAVMDEKARNDMLSANFDPNIIQITGQPALDEIFEQRQDSFNAEQDALTEKLNIRRGKTILFISQPLREFYSQEGIIPPNKILDEQIIFQKIASACKSISKTHNLPIHLLLRCHPREKPSSWSELLKDFPDTIDVTELDRFLCVKGCDLVSGIQSILLIEATLLGKTVISVQPGNADYDCLPSNASGASYPIYNEKKIEDRICAALLDPSFAREQKKKQEATFSPSGASQKIATLINDLIKA